MAGPRSFTVKPSRALRKADQIYDTMLMVFDIAREQGVPTYVAADRLAERRIEDIRSMVRTGTAHSFTA